MEKLIEITAAVGCIVAGIIIWIVILMILYSEQPDKNADVTKNSELCAIRYYSETNSWIDLVIFIAKRDLIPVRKLIMSAMHSFWNDDEYSDVPYGDIVEMSLEKAGFPYAVVYYPISKDDDSEEEKVWKKFIQNIENVMELVVIKEA